MPGCSEFAEGPSPPQALESELTDLPWVGHHSRRWEPEPLRWLGINAGLRAAALADAEERATRRPSQVAKVIGRLVG